MVPIIGGPSGEKEHSGNLSFWTHEGKNKIIAWGADNQAGVELSQHNGKTAVGAGVTYLIGTDDGTVDCTKGIRYELDPDGVIDVTIRK